MKMLRVLAFVTVAFAIIMGAVYWNNSSNDRTMQELPVTNIPAGAVSIAPVNLVGHWKSLKDKKPSMIAEITSDFIDISFTDEGSTVGYWYGTFQQNKTSQTSVAIDNGKLVLSTAQSKDFTYVNGKIRFDVAMLGATTKVELERA